MIWIKSTREGMPGLGEQPLAMHLDLREFELFSSLTREDALEMYRTARILQMPAGSLVFQQGDEAIGFYLVKQGAVKIFKTNPSGQEQALHVTVAGQSFAEAAVFQGERYPANAACVEDSVLVFIERKTLLAQLRRDPELALRMLAGMALKHHHLVRLVEDLTLRDARGRICRYLLGLLPTNASQEAPPPTVRLPVSQTLLARLLGLTGETLSRVLKALHDEGIVQLKGRGLFQVCDVVLLQAAVDL